MEDNEDDLSSNKSLVSEPSPSSNCPIPANPKLLAEGWELRFFGDYRMAREASITYKDLDFEVRLEPVNTDNMEEGCSGCKPAFTDFSMVYTRKKKR